MNDDNYFSYLSQCSQICRKYNIVECSEGDPLQESNEAESGMPWSSRVINYLKKKKKKPKMSYFVQENGQLSKLGIGRCKSPVLTFDFTTGKVVLEYLVVGYCYHSVLQEI